MRGFVFLDLECCLVTLDRIGFLALIPVMCSYLGQDFKSLVLCYWWIFCQDLVADLDCQQSVTGSIR